MMIDKRLINTVADSKKWIAINVLWNWVALIGGIISAVVFAIYHRFGCLSGIACLGRENGGESLL